ncbi:MAG: hypothetical protein ACRC8K_11265 [Waterburya sp.]
MFKTMFERATIFSSIFIFIFFGILGHKYLKFVEAKNQTNPAATSITSSQ